MGYNDGNTQFNAVLDVGLGNWWATWRLDGSATPDVGIPLNFTVEQFTSNKPVGFVYSHYWNSWDVSLKDYEIDVYSFPQLSLTGIEHYNVGHSQGKITSEATAALSFAGTAIMTAASFCPPLSTPLIIGRLVGLGVSGVTSAINYFQGQPVSRYTTTQGLGDNHCQLVANAPMSFTLDTYIGNQVSESDIVFLGMQATGSPNCGLTKAVLTGTLEAKYTQFDQNTGYSYTYFDCPIGTIQITICTPWFIWPN